jgi:uncharacterized protein YutE (UPF0331/DUF86 family)
MDTEVVLVRLRLITKYLNTLAEDFASLTYEDYAGDFRKQLIVERLIRLLVEAASNINIYLLVQLHEISPENTFDSFIQAGRQGILRADLATQIAQSTKMRNILVHQYKDIDKQIVFNAIPKALQQYRLYVEQIRDYLDALEVDNG